MMRWWNQSSETKGAGAVVRALVALCLVSPTSAAWAYEKSESSDAANPSAILLSSSGLAGLASLESAVKEMASMPWTRGSNVATAAPETPKGEAAATAKAEGGAGSDGSTAIPKNSLLPANALAAARASGDGSSTGSSGAQQASTSPSSTPSSGSTGSTSSSVGSKGLSLSMPASEADKLRRMSDRINGSIGTLAGTVKDAQDRNKNALNPSGKDKKMNEGGSPIDRDAASKAKFGATGDLSLNTIADNRAKEDDPFEEFLKDQKKKQQANKEKEKSKEEKEKEEKERKELEQKMTELANKPPPFTLQDYYDFRDLIAKKNKAMGDLADNQPDFAKKAQTIFDEFSSRDGDESKKNAFREFVENSRERELFQNPIIVDPIPGTHRVGASH